MAESVAIQEGRFEEILGTAFAPVIALSELIKNSSDACTVVNDTILVDINTNDRMVSVQDNGYGFSKEDIENLKIVGLSAKMISNNNISRIGEPYAGSKGLGLLTAFFICNKLEINTFSEKDKCAYRIIWVKGTATIQYEELTDTFIGTTVKLIDVSPDNIKMLTMKSELQKLYLISINYYKESKTLPHIKFHVNGNFVNYAPNKKLENVYQNNKRGNNGFIAKASFRYSKDKLYISYEDNYRHVYEFNDYMVDLNDSSSFNDFLINKSIFIKRVKDFWGAMDEFRQHDLDDFEGVFYIWRGTKVPEVAYPSNIKIYVNNYGLYKYLNEKDDWLGLAQISQNVKATNYKPKNAFGYVCFTNYNESVSSLKISPERNSFIVGVTEKKFETIMDFLVAVFTAIDINIKQLSSPNNIKFKLRYQTRKIFLGEKISMSDVLTTTIPLNQIDLEYDSDIVHVNELFEIWVNKLGSHAIHFVYDGEILTLDVQVKDPTPSYEVKDREYVDQNNSFDLNDLILKSINMQKSDIKISSDAKIKNFTFLRDNPPKSYIIDFLYEKGDYYIQKQSEIVVKPIHISAAKRVLNLLPNYDNVEKFEKIKELINGIADSYISYPTLAMAGLRSLIEILISIFLKEFFGDGDYDKQSSKAVSHRIKDVYNLYRKPGVVDDAVVNMYATKLTKDAGTRLGNYYDNHLDPNSYVHNPISIATPEEVLYGFRKFQFLFNFIIDALIAKQRNN